MSTCDGCIFGALGHPMVHDAVDTLCASGAVTQEEVKAAVRTAFPVLKPLGPRAAGATAKTLYGLADIHARGMRKAKDAARRKSLAILHSGLGGPQTASSLRTLASLLGEEGIAKSVPLTGIASALRRKSLSPAFEAPAAAAERRVAEQKVHTRLQSMVSSGVLTRMLGASAFDQGGASPATSP